MNIYVGNLAYGAQNKDLEDLFAQHGAVKRVHISVDKETGRPRGFAFVEMETAEDGDRAIKALDGHDVLGRQIRVSEAKPRDEGAAKVHQARGDRGGYGGGDRGGYGGGDRGGYGDRGHGGGHGGGDRPRGPRRDNRDNDRSY